MFRWLARWCGSFRETEAVDDPRRLRAEIRRLDEMIAAYRDFGFDDLAADGARRKSALQEELRRLRSKAGAA